MNTYAELDVPSREDRWRKAEHEKSPPREEPRAPALTLAEVDQRIEQRIAGEHELLLEIFAALLAQMQREPEMRGPKGPAGPQGEQGERGKMSVVKDWLPDIVHYAGDIVTHGGATFQARRDTGQAPSHADWACLAAAGRDGRDGRSITVRGTYDAKASYAALDIVAVDGGAFIARRDNPGACPGEGWQMVARQGHRGVAGAKGERGFPGPKGDAAAMIYSWKIDAERYTATPVMSDGTSGPPLNLRGLFEQFQDEVG